jgi:prephenate dehydrogenase
MNQTKPPFNKITIIGVGLIGGSLGMAVRKRGLAREVIGYDRNREALSKAVRLKAIDGFEEALDKAVDRADLVVLAAPVGSFDGLAAKLTPLLHPKTVITDTGSTKGALVERLEKLLSPHGLFVAGHPIAGGEKSGVEAASESLFEKALCILTPTPHTEPEALKRIQTLWESVGSRVVLMDPQRHDRIFAAVSHLPHVVAYALVALTAELSVSEPDLPTYSAGGFRDFTRIAASSPEMWRDISLANGEEIIRLIERYEKTLTRFKKLIQDKDASGLMEQFEAAKAIREKLNKQANS